MFCWRIVRHLHWPPPSVRVPGGSIGL
jgi:hypothetical protein